ncbi:hypothetical protein ACFPYI_00935 [Halomarina salina]|uniref:AbrB/MazE/SpoVT family DNA-binding domain-containing protein n=1 Tax=Halomarina salina TaxID=1872699 RepID=A0ABD5RHT5_9EURY|nr:hypothetical protein [Halomarina salina]
MSDAGRFRDSTQIVLPRGRLGDLRADLGREFTLTFVEQDGRVRIIGSPVEIKSASDWLVRHGISLP